MPHRYTLHPSAIPRDDHGQLAHVTKLHWENYLSKSFDQLNGICHGILADGVISDQEARYFRDWLDANSTLETSWPFSELTRRVSAIFADGIITDDEREDLFGIMTQITGGSYMPVVGKDDTSTTLPLNVPVPDMIEFSAREFSITGRFAFGTRTKVVEAITERGGAFNNHPRQSTHYLVIGHFCSRDWKHTNYGLKIERAVELREGKFPIAIISEETWTRSLAE